MLVIHIEGHGARASEVAEILAAADKSFSRFGRERVAGLKPVLTVEAVKPGSVDIALGVLETYDTARNLVALLAPFAAHLCSVFELIRAGGLQQVTVTDRKLARSIIAPVAKGHAQQMNIVNNGTIAIEINGENAGDLLQSVTSTLTTRSANPPKAQSLSPTHARELEGPGLEGVALFVEDQWYARLLFGQGVLVPVQGAIKSLIHNRAYRFRGRTLSGSRGEVVGIDLASAEPN